MNIKAFSGNLSKRIKRHVLGRNRSFFISTLPGFESLCRNELLGLNFSASDIRKGYGGISFNGRVHDCYTANLKLRSANRILMRLASFKATNFRQLDKRVVTFPWELYLQPAEPPAVHVKTRHSRLFHSDAVAEHFKAGIGEYFSRINTSPKDNSDHPSCLQQIFVRCIQDRMTVSIDSSGEPLFKRGLKTHGGHAPIRETTAASILLHTGYQADELLVDPMCGTGTFSLEGAMITNCIPPGWFRDFAFMHWPCFKPARWAHIRRQAEKLINPAPDPLIVASDKDALACQSLKETVLKNGLQQTITVFNQDFFDLQTADIHRMTRCCKNGLIALNPPYGRRLKAMGKDDKWVIEICQKLKTDFRGWKFVMILPEKKALKLVPFRVHTKNLLHGGLRLTLLSGRVE